MVNFRKFLNDITKQKSELYIRQSDWTTQGGSVLKKWGITGALNSGVELEIMAHVGFTKSALFDRLDPHILFAFNPNTFGNIKGFITAQICKADAPLEYPFGTAYIETTEDGRVVISLGAGGLNIAESAFDVLSETKPFRLTFLANEELIFQMTLPNTGNNLADATREILG